ncbi:hypothetical protein CGRA01v4_04738 [Colletotrichum graminicola]|uniref:Uncharacterized protein n=1 Tax=Colletotrichum graminicola (strain M1.001 / M2 / FGSC 10212) TaxID=645133 RepID=E3QLI2_COLGM|nr:uncharacterized protein GLRG_06695 [Colletotrichum graminicola M1.001]EFQ31720.1 hypothetical protein GLRG_06695 [Colletotrichum graminicola M1.001]WDK13457.1 hypothetical protein CGRA01v4_04738 [Colletotrichum graminicola]
MEASPQQNGNADAASNVAEQGSAYSGNSRGPNTVEQNSAEKRARLDLFLADTALQGRSSDHAGTVEHQDARTRRILDAVTAIDELLPKKAGSEPTDGQADDNLPMDLQGIGKQFDE